ncbi:hypothetical protein LUZ60_012138 [Juncus effusus]|nr:hypothetical protein LUZ60_012138 [Juncus effusus]
MNFLRSSTPPPPQQHHQQTYYLEKINSSSTNNTSRSSASSVRSFSSDVSDQQEQQQQDNQNKTNKEDEEEERVYVAVGKEVKEWKANFLWVMQNIPRTKKITLVHIHRPSKTVPFMGGWIPADQLNINEVASYRQVETEKLNKTIHTYLTMFLRFKIKAQRIVIERDDIADGLVSLISEHGITELVMGGAADKHYSRKMKAPVSKTALAVNEQADPACKIWFVCSGNLISTREPRQIQISAPVTPQPPPTNYPHTSSNRNPNSQMPPHQQGQYASSSMDERYNPGSRSPYQEQNQNHSRAGSTATSANSSPYHELAGSKWGPGNGEQGRGYYVENSSSNRPSTKDDDLPYPRGKWPQEATELDDLKNQREEILQNLIKADEQKESLELEVSSSRRLIKELQEKLSEAHCLVFSLEREVEELQQERACAVKEANLLRERVRELESQVREKEKFCEFSYEEIQEATNGFDEGLKIGQGGYGSVYKGVINEKTVAIKVLNPQGMQGKDEFYKEMDVLSKIKHPNLVTLIGACPEAYALVYEFLPNGSLEDRLSSKEKSEPLTWRARIRISAEICSALMFLHSTSNKTIVVIHGDLKPANILLDDNLVSRLGDFGICRLLAADANTILFRCSGPTGTFVYMDPEFLASGELRPCSDVYSFGIVLLRLLTGRPALGIINEVHKAVEKGKLEDILDKTAGDWPLEVATQIADLGLRCCEIKRKARPDLAKEAWNVLEPMMNNQP